GHTDTCSEILNGAGSKLRVVARRTPGGPAHAAGRGRGALIAPAPVTALPTAAATRLGPGLVDREGPAARLPAVEGGDGGLGLLVAAHLHEPEALGPARVPVHDHLGRLHGAVGPEHRREIAVGHAVAQVADVQLLTHVRTPRGK